MYNMNKGIGIIILILLIGLGVYFFAGGFAGNSDNGTSGTTSPTETATSTQDNDDGDEKQSAATTSTETGGDGSAAQACRDEGGRWLAEHSECESADGSVTEAWCTEQGGSYESCASACRHDPDADMCTQQCVQVCQL